MPHSGPTSARARASPGSPSRPRPSCVARTGCSMRTLSTTVPATPSRSALGNLSRKLSNANLSLNQIAPDVLASLRAQGITTQLQQYRPYPQFTDVLIQFPSNGLSDYYAVLVRADKRFSGGLSFGANYTF